MKNLLFDVETTHLNPKKGFIVSIGSLIYDDVTGSVRKFYCLLNWKMIYPTFTAEMTKNIHKISDDELEKDGFHPLKAFADYYDFIAEEDQLDVISAFNTAYDHNMFMSNLLNLVENTEEESEDLTKCMKLLNIFKKGYGENEENKILFLDSMLIDRIFHYEVDYQKVSHGLEAVGVRYGIPVDENAHNALADTERTLEIYKYQLQELKELGVELNDHFELRLIKQYRRNQEKWKKQNKEQLDYLGVEMTAAVFE